MERIDEIFSLRKCDIQGAFRISGNGYFLLLIYSSILFWTSGTFSFDIGE